MGRFPQGRQKKTDEPNRHWSMNVPIERGKQDLVSALMTTSGLPTKVSLVRLMGQTMVETRTTGQSCGVIP